MQKRQDIIQTGGERKEQAIARAVMAYKFFCPECNRRLQVNGARHSERAATFNIKKCECGFKSESMTLTTDPNE